MRGKNVGTFVAALFFLSGTSGLVFEVVWLRYLTLVIGHTTFAASIVVSAFLGGLALGSLIVGRAAARSERPLVLYAALEAATGVLALGLTLVLRRTSEIGAFLGAPGGGPLALRAVITFLLVLPPTTVMGGTLPVLTRFVARELPKVGRSFAFLYGMNTLGAAFGCGVAGYYVIGRYGLWRTAILAAATNILVAAFALFIARGATRTELPPLATEPADPLPAGKRRLLVAAFALSGLASISYEVLWFRVLGFYLPTTSYAFTTLLTTFLVGLVLGSLVYVTRLAGRVRDLSTFVSAQVLLAWTGLLSMILLGRVHGIRAALTSFFSTGSLGGLGWSDTPPLQVVAFSLVPAAMVMLVPTTIIGVIFPCVVQLTTRHLKTTSRDVGVLYSVNTFGGIVGSLLTGFVAIPALGTQMSFLLVAALNMVLALLVLRLDAAATKRERIRVFAAALLLLPAMRIVPFDYLLGTFSEIFSGRPLRLVEGRDGLVSVIEHDAQLACAPPAVCSEECRSAEWSHRQLLFGSTSYAATLMPGRRYMAALAHLPMLFHEAPRDALVVCFGTGTTAGTFARYPDLRSLVVVDLNRDVLAAAPLFAASNYDVASDPRVTLVVDDGRHFVLATDRRFDVISFEPPPPTAAGVVNLYTREFYELVAAHLGEKGVLTQWIPLDHQSDMLDRMLVKSMLDVFSDVALFIPSRHEGVLVASRAPLSVDLARWRVAFDDPKLAAAMSSVGFDGPERLLGTFIADRKRLERWTAGHAAVTDDMPVVEYFLQRNDGPFRPRALFEPPADVGSLLPAATPAERARIDAQLRATTRLLSAHEASRSGDRALARSLVAEAAEIGGANAFTSYEIGVDYRCLDERR